MSESEEVKIEDQVIDPNIPNDFKIEQLFGSKTRARLLSLFLENSERAFYVRELTRKINAQLNSVRRELKNLVEMGIVLEVIGTIIENENIEQQNKKPKKGQRKKFYKVNTKFIFFDELRNIMKKSSILMNKTLVSDLCENGKIDLLFLTGRFVDNNDVPSDLLVVGDVNIRVLKKAISDFEKLIGREVNYTYMPKDEFTYRKEVKDRFLASLINTEKVILVNDLLEVV